MIRRLFAFLCLFIYISTYAYGETANDKIMDQKRRQTLCGPLCLQKKCEQFGVNISVDRIAQISGTNINGTSLKGLADAACAFGLKAYGLKTNIENLSGFKRAVIAHIQSKHFVVIKNLPNGKVLIFDPQSEMPDKISTLDEFNKIWTRYILVVEPAQPVTGNQPAILIEDPVFDFGQVPQETTIEHDFIVKNIGRKILEIQHTTQSCVCTVTNLRDSKVLPGRFTTIRVQYNTKHMRGRQVVRVNISSNDPNDPIADIIITGFVAGNVLVSPNFIYIEPTPNQTIHKILEVYDPGHGKLKIERVDTTSPNIKIQVIPKKYHKANELAALINVTIKLGISQGLIQEKILIYTNDRKYPVTEVRIEGNAKGYLTIFPRQFFYGTVCPGQRITRTLVIRYSGNNILRILKMEVGSKSIITNVSEIETGRRYNIIGEF